jgi:hypothetical protein
VLATLLAGPITLAHRVILLLLSGFLPAALLLPWLVTWLLTWALLTGVLSLLTRILVLLLRHRGGTPLLDVRGKVTTVPGFGCRAEPGSSQLRNRGR